MSKLLVQIFCFVAILLLGSNVSTALFYLLLLLLFFFFVILLTAP